MSVVIPKENTRQAKLPTKESDSKKASIKPSKKRASEESSNEPTESPAKKSKKAAKSSDDQPIKQKQSADQKNQSADSTNQSESETKKKGKRKRSSESAESLVESESADQSSSESTTKPAKQPVAQKKAPPAKRFIVFVGNLPYRCSKETLAKYFDVADDSVRIPTDKDNNKPKGFAFIEFTEAFGLQRALKLHHTEFQERKINVELTAGGGGKSETRTKKIAVRNEKLTKQRQNSAAKRATDKTNKGEGEQGAKTHAAAPASKTSESQTAGQSEEPAKKKRKRKPRKKAGEEAADSE